MRALLGRGVRERAVSLRVGYHLDPPHILVVREAKSTSVLAATGDDDVLVAQTFRGAGPASVPNRLCELEV
jgi:hypothetical protein